MTITKMNSEDKSVVIACMAALVAVMSPFLADSYSPSLPAITHALGSNANVMQLTMSLYLLGASLSQLIYGPFSDRFGRRPLIVFGLMTAIVGSFFCAIATTVWFLLFARVVQGIGAGACNALFRALMRDQFSGAKLAQVGSYTGIIYTTSFAVAPIIGGYWQSTLGWRANFFFVTGLVLLTVIIIWRLLPETNQSLNPHATRPVQFMKNYKMLFSSPIFVCYSLMASIGFAYFVCYYAAAPFLLENIVGLSPVQFGWLSFLIALGSVTGLLSNARLVMKFGIQRMIISGLVLLILTCITMLAFALMGVINTEVIIIPMIFISVAAGLIFSNAMANAFQPFAHMAGSAGAVYGCLQMLGAATASALLAGVHENSQLPLALIFIGITVLLCLIYTFLRQREKKYAV